MIKLSRKLGALLRRPAPGLQREHGGGNVAPSDADVLQRPEWMSPEAFRLFKNARAELQGGGGREMTIAELRAEFGLGRS